MASRVDTASGTHSTHSRSDESFPPLAQHAAQDLLSSRPADALAPLPAVGDGHSQAMSDGHGSVRGVVSEWAQAQLCARRSSASTGAASAEEVQQRVPVLAAPATRANSSELDARTSVPAQAERDAADGATACTTALIVTGAVEETPRSAQAGGSGPQEEAAGSASAAEAAAAPVMPWNVQPAPPIATSPTSSRTLIGPAAGACVTASSASTRCGTDSMPMARSDLGRVPATDALVLAQSTCAAIGDSQQPGAAGLLLAAPEARDTSVAAPALASSHTAPPWTQPEECKAVVSRYNRAPNPDSAHSTSDETLYLAQHAAKEELDPPPPDALVVRPSAGDEHAQHMSGGRGSLRVVSSEWVQAQQRAAGSAAMGMPPNVMREGDDCCKSRMLHCAAILSVAMSVPACVQVRRRARRKALHSTHLCSTRLLRSTLCSM